MVSGLGCGAEGVHTCRECTFSVAWNGMKSISCSSVSLFTQSLVSAFFPLASSALGLLLSMSVLTVPKSPFALSSSSPFKSAWSVTSLNPLGNSALRHAPPEPPVEPPELPEPTVFDGPPPSVAILARSPTMACSFCTFAPCTLSASSPCLNTMNVGRLDNSCQPSHPFPLLSSLVDGKTHAVTLYLAATSLCVSVLTLTNVMRFSCESDCESFSYIGAICLHGPHQSA